MVLCIIYARFGSPFDFGANYNLTSNDMTYRGFVFGRTPFGLFSYLFQPPVYSEKFPYISSVYYYTSYMGKTIYESMFGGVIFNNIFLCINFFIIKFKYLLKEKRLYWFCVLSFIFAIIVIIIDTQASGVLFRYCSDFSYLLFLSACIMVLLMFEKFSKASVNVKKLLRGIMLFCFIGCMFYNISSLFFLGSYELNTQNPSFFYSIMHLVQFWL